jgi:hypothetical protein
MLKPGVGTGFGGVCAAAPEAKQNAANASVVEVKMRLAAETGRMLCMLGS